MEPGSPAAGGAVGLLQPGNPKRSATLVLYDHDQELMVIPGVVGMYVGLLNDGRTSCLNVMLVDKTQEMERKIPKSLEGYTVVIDETGVIYPIHGK